MSKNSLEKQLRSLKHTQYFGITIGIGQVLLQSFIIYTSGFNGINLFNMAFGITVTIYFIHSRKESKKQYEKYMAIKSEVNKDNKI